MLKSITRYVDLTLHPERYHGHEKQPPFFEGWYYKIVSADRQTRFAIIPGIFLSDDPTRHHAFVQVFDGMTGHATYHRYAASEFEAARGDFHVRVGKSEFRCDCIKLDIADEQRTVQGELHFERVISWPVTLAKPGIMGPFGWLPFMECYHGVLGLDHTVSGCLTIDGAVHDFAHGRGYIEKDWGQSFPSGWVWMQTNHFAQPGISLSASNAVIPFMGTSFIGYIVGLWHHGELHQFATYLRSKTERMEIDQQHVRWQITNNSHRLEIIAHRADATPLPGPDKIEMGKRAPETMRSQIEVTLTRRVGGKPVFSGTGECAALEVAGEWERLIV